MVQQWGRVAVIGDVGGHLVELVEMLVRLGVDPATGNLPDDLTVVQVGDLVHRGPRSSDVVFFVDAVMRSQPGRWVQLVGNHEQLEVSDAVFVWDEVLHPGASLLLDDWWATGMMKPAAAIVVKDGPEMLATHAGLTSSFWRSLGSPSTATRAASLINALDRTPGSKLWRAGSMLGQAAPTFQAGPIWASAHLELLPSWAHDGAPRMPFDQVHGHSRVVDHATGRRRGRVPADVTAYDPGAQHETSTLPGGARIIGIDPQHGALPSPVWQPLLLPSARVSA